MNRTIIKVDTLESISNWNDDNIVISVNNIEMLDKKMPMPLKYIIDISSEIVVIGNKIVNGIEVGEAVHYCVEHDSILYYFIPRKKADDFISQLMVGEFDFDVTFNLTDKGVVVIHLDGDDKPFYERNFKIDLLSLNANSTINENPIFPRLAINYGRNVLEVELSNIKLTDLVTMDFNVFNKFLLSPFNLKYKKLYVVDGFGRISVMFFSSSPLFEAEKEILDLELVYKEKQRILAGFGYIDKIFVNDDISSFNRKIKAYLSRIKLIDLNKTNISKFVNIIKSLNFSEGPTTLKAQNLTYHILLTVQDKILSGLYDALEKIKSNGISKIYYLDNIIKNYAAYKRTDINGTIVTNFEDCIIEFDADSIVTSVCFEIPDEVNSKIAEMAEDIDYVMDNQGNLKLNIDPEVLTNLQWVILKDVEITLHLKTALGMATVGYKTAYRLNLDTTGEFNFKNIYWDKDMVIGHALSVIQIAADKDVAKQQEKVNKMSESYEKHLESIVNNSESTLIRARNNMNVYDFGHGMQRPMIRQHGIDGPIPSHIINPYVASRMPHTTFERNNMPIDIYEYEQLEKAKRANVTQPLFR